ncbi:tautomerase family protein [Orrella daihaiensis]|uniref:Tautomerase family protein n=1 Tax=Orrella daihaiensis TaxID=2782176 RepID=A0ABY4ALI9_9BURK|nr:tautomerase family protein [Orrella daihaiensis]UOD50808.1 tautomerase family protein [Orrella daihaiensis]
MPILTIKIPSGHSQEQKAALLKGLTDAVLKSLNAPLPSIRISIDEVPAQNTMVAGVLGQPNALVHAALIAGRTEQLKAALIAEIAQAVERSIGLSAEHTRVLIQDYPTTDMGVAGGISAKAAGR